MNTAREELETAAYMVAFAIGGYGLTDESKITTETSWFGLRRKKVDRNLVPNWRSREDLTGLYNKLINAADAAMQERSRELFAAPPQTQGREETT